MAYYLVTAKPLRERLPELRRRIDVGEVAQMRPFGHALHYGLTEARALDAEWAIWEEEDYCRPPLAMERAAVLDDYFTELSVELVNEGEGWARIASLARLWI